MSTARILTALLVTAALFGCSGPSAGPQDKAEAAAAASAAPAAASQDDGRLCEHRVPEALCTRCNPDLADVFREEGDWCDEHGVPESQCFQCNPDLTFADPSAAPKDWCREHSVPESKCTKCKPALIAGFVEAGNYCREHGYPQDVCPFCHPELVRAAGQVPPAEAPLGTRVRLKSADTAAEAGLEVVKVEKQRFAGSLEVVGQLSFDQNRYAQLTAPGEVRIVEVRADIGDDVAAGAPIVVLLSAEVGEEHADLAAARAEVAAAKASVEREARLEAKGISSRRSVEEARAQLARAQAGYDSAVAGLKASGASTAEAGGRFELSAPFDGTIVSRDAVAGRSVRDGQVLVEVADLSTLWAMLDVPEADAARVAPGQPVELTLEGVHAESLHATIGRVGSSVDRSTRTVPVRVELANPDHRLKAGMFVRARIQVSAQRDAVLVPKDAVQSAEGRSIVLVRKEASLFEPVTVQLGEQRDGLVEVTRGLEPGQEVVTTGAFLLKTELLKDAIGAGCCEESE